MFYLFSAIVVAWLVLIFSLFRCSYASKQLRSNLQYHRKLHWESVVRVSVSVAFVSMAILIALLTVGLKLLDSK